MLDVDKPITDPIIQDATRAGMDHVFMHQPTVAPWIAEAIQIAAAQAVQRERAKAEQAKSNRLHLQIEGEGVQVALFEVDGLNVRKYEQTGIGTPAVEIEHAGIKFAPIKSNPIDPIDIRRSVIATWVDRLEAKAGEPFDGRIIAKLRTGEYVRGTCERIVCERIVREDDPLTGIQVFVLEDFIPE